VDIPLRQPSRPASQRPAATAAERVLPVVRAAAAEGASVPAAEELKTAVRAEVPPAPERPLNPPSDPAAPFTQRQGIALGGAALLLFGVFAPIVTMPIVGSINYFQNGRGDGSIIAALALATAYFALKKRYSHLWWTGLAAGAVMLFTFVNFQLRMSEVRSSMNEDLAGNPFRGLADLAIGSVQLSWGWVLLVLGVACVLYAAKGQSISPR
jgi:hypothetical protein